MHAHAQQSGALLPPEVVDDVAAEGLDPALVQDAQEVVPVVAGRAVAVGADDAVAQQVVVRVVGGC